MSNNSDCQPSACDPCPHPADPCLRLSLCGGHFSTMLCVADVVAMGKGLKLMYDNAKKCDDDYDPKTGEWKKRPFRSGEYCVAETAESCQWPTGCSIHSKQPTPA